LLVQQSRSQDSEVRQGVHFRQCEKPGYGVAGSTLQAPKRLRRCSPRCAKGVVRSAKKRWGERHVEKAGHVIEPDGAIRESAVVVGRGRICIAGCREEVTDVAVAVVEQVVAIEANGGRPIDTLSCPVDSSRMTMSVLPTS
jgi:hypothetical protein